MSARALVSQVEQDLFLTKQLRLFSTLQVLGNQHYVPITTESFFLQFCRRAREKQRNFLSLLLSQSASGAGKRRYTTNKNKLHSVRGGCLGAQCRRRTRRPAKRSGGAAYKR